MSFIQKSVDNGSVLPTHHRVTDGTPESSEIQLTGAPTMLCSLQPDELDDTPLGWMAQELGIQQTTHSLPFTFFTLDGSEPTPEQLAFLYHVEQEVRTIRQKEMAIEVERSRAVAVNAIWKEVAGFDELSEDLPEDLAQELDEVLQDKDLEFSDEASANPPEQSPMDVKLFVTVSLNALEAWGLLLPPRHGGGWVDEDALLAQLELANISFGIDMAKLREMIAQKQWMKLFVVARGQAPLDGQDGRIIEHFSRDKRIRLQPDDAESVDYRNLNWLQKVSEGGVICDVILPTPCADGRSVTGEVIPAHVGKPVKAPAGQNTRMNEEYTQLLATCDGQVLFKNELFHVVQVLDIPGDVDNSVGNLDVLGDLLIHGNVADGFTLKATGNIVVMGLVEGAFLNAGGNIQVSVGMKGNFKGVLEAKGNVQCKYLENCTVRAGGNLVANSAINCTIACGDSVLVLSGRGVIIGGQVGAVNMIKAKMIGNEFNRATALVLGPDVMETESIQQSKDELDALQRAIDEAGKNINYLESVGRTEPPYDTLLSQLKLKWALDKMKHAKKSKALQAKITALSNINSQVLATTLYPSTSITMGGLRLKVRQTARRCRVFKDNGELVIREGVSSV